jgi:predicted transcriptional regulator
MNSSPSAKSTPRLALCAATAADLMAENPVSIGADVSLQEAATFLADKGFSAAPVIDEAGRPVGVLSTADIVVHDRKAIQEIPGNPEFYVGPDLSRPNVRQANSAASGPIRVRDIMTPAVFSVPPDMAARQVIEAMLAEKVHRLFVVGSDGVLIGTISTVDILQHLKPVEA